MFSVILIMMLAGGEKCPISGFDIAQKCYRPTALCKSFSPLKGKAGVSFRTLKGRVYCLLRIAMSRRTAGAATGINISCVGLYADL